ncbi:MAG: endolytic transglycosylase MltG [Bifidobacterium sp.]|nr:endolytic transglycosylase MltG [Bifidobacterium sp.]
MPEHMDDFFDADSWGASGDPSHGRIPPKPPKSRREMRKRRRRKQRRRLRAMVFALVVIVVIAAAGYFSYVKLKAWSNEQRQSSTQISDYPGPGYGKVQFTVETGDDAPTVAKKLVTAGVVKTQDAFTSAVTANASTLYPGTYSLKLHMDAQSVVTILSDPSKASGFLEIRSGERVSDIVADASSLTKIGESEFTTVIKSGGTGILPPEAGGKFEGWLEPGTYDVKSQKSAASILKLIVDKRIDKLNSLDVPTGAQRERILVISSIAESEVNSNDYYGKVARVIINRLNKGMNLGMDTTVAYGLGIKASQLTDAMLADKSNPYNTRVNAGLPPGPISNPGDDAILAAMNPPAGDWLYFVTTNLQTGETKFATTEDEFWKIRNEYKDTNKNAN